MPQAHRCGHEESVLFCFCLFFFFTLFLPQEHLNSRCTPPGTINVQADIPFLALMSLLYILHEEFVE